MSSKYYQYFDYPNWLDARDRLLDYKQKNIPSDEDYYGFNDDEFPTDFKDIIDECDKLGLYIKQLVFLSIFPTDLSNIDVNDLETIHERLYKHIDQADDFEHSTQSVKTFFNPKYSLNIPLINFEKSITFFYDFIDPYKDHVQHSICGGRNFKYRRLIEVERFTLYQPAILKVDAPHAVYNPTNDLRIVCTLRLDDNSPALKRLFK